MATITIDTYASIERLTRSGIPDAQAKAIVDVLSSTDLASVATKEDIASLRVEIANVKVELLKWIVPILLSIPLLTAAFVRLLG